MKLRTSYFNPTAFKKDVLRFAPAWALYTIFLLMGMMLCFLGDNEYHRVNNVADSIAGMAVVNLCYGLLNAQLLFGDLYNARLCNALHAMPLRRECWFGTHVVAGLAFSFVPNLAASLVALPVLGVGWSVALWWLLASCLQYLCFFGLATLSALCVGNRFAMAVVYGIINFLSVLVYWFYSTLYEPLLYGVRADSAPFLAWSPVVRMVENYDMVEVVRSGETYYTWTVEAVYPGEGWGYLAICAALGVAVMALALVLYRRRKLETAGDFMAFRTLEPVFLVLYTMTVGAFFQLFSDALFGTAANYVFLAIGLTVGFFTGRMLLMRTVRVFQPKAFLAFGILAAVLTVSLLLTWWDVLGITRRIPDTEDVVSVRISDDYYYYARDYNGMELDTPQEIDGIRRMHQMILDGQTDPNPEDDSSTVYLVRVSLDYSLKNGTRLTRYYSVAVESPVGQFVEQYYTDAEYIFGVPAEEVETLIDQMAYLYIRIEDGDGQQDPTSPLAEGLLRAIVADCEAGTMAQEYGYHADSEEVNWVEFRFDTPDGNSRYVTINIYPECENTVAYMKENGLPVYDQEYFDIEK
ncbi:MAG: hypothetical protein IJX69_01415 [Oscillospiraceae bacterium]|nr:hypothetical protein [Oscillospiraceae bacterium]